MKLKFPVIATFLCGIGGMLLMENNSHRFIAFTAYICVLSGGFMFGYYVAKGERSDK